MLLQVHAIVEYSEYSLYMTHFTQRRALEAVTVLLMIQCTRRSAKEPGTALLIFSAPAKAPSAPAAAPVLPHLHQYSRSCASAPAAALPHSDICLFGNKLFLRRCGQCQRHCGFIINLRCAAAGAQAQLRVHFAPLRVHFAPLRGHFLV